jgi:hypothetical protein
MIEAPAFIYAGAFFASWLTAGLIVSLVAWSVDGHNPTAKMFVAGVCESPGQFVLFLMVWPLVVYVLVADTLEDD